MIKRGMGSGDGIVGCLLPPKNTYSGRKKHLLSRLSSLKPVACCRNFPAHCDLNYSPNPEYKHPYTILSTPILACIFFMFSRIIWQFPAFSGQKVDSGLSSDLE